MDISQKFTDVISQFSFEGTLAECIPFGSGHINDTYRLTFDKDGAEVQYIIQKMNREVFHKPEEVMENIRDITEWLRREIRAAGGDIRRETLNIIPTKGGKTFYIDPEGEYWRAFLFIENASCYDQVKKKEDFYQCALAFGNFQRLLADYPADTLHETIPDFHNTVDRYSRFEAAVVSDTCGRTALVQNEIRFVRNRRALTHELCDKQADGTLPLRVTHNDTKLNNVMFDNETGKAICVIDLDTVMPGLSANDFGDAIRFGASTALEDERDLSKVSCDMELYELYVKGYMESCGQSLTEEEINALPMGAILMTFECGMRFLTDYLEGDHYFKIDREGQNLDRARTQFKLVEDMEQKLTKMRLIVEKYRSPLPPAQQ